MVAATTSSAALCSVSVSQDILDKDLVLHLILKTVQSRTHQVTLNILAKQKKAGTQDDPSLTLTLADGSELANRQAILRSLAGAALHGSMDMKFGWLGASRSNNNYAVASMTQWMKFAAAIPSSDPQGVKQILDSCDKMLTHSAFLVPFTSTCTLADLDLAVALQRCLNTKNDQQQEQPQHVVPASVARWMHQVGCTVQSLAKETGVKLDLEFPPPPRRPCMPIFFDGTEDVDATLAQLLVVQGGGQSPSKGKPQQGKPQTQGGKDNDGNDGKKNKKEAKKEKQATESNNETQKASTAAAPPDQVKIAQQEPATFDISALDIRVGKIIKVWPHETADKLFCEEIDLGNGEVRQIASGLRPFYKDSDLQDRAVLVLCNLKKRSLVGFSSHGMVLCASNADHTAVEFVVPPEGTVVGERVAFEGIDPDVPPEPENKVAKKKIFEQLAPDLKTNDAGHVVWKSHVAKTSAGIVQALNKMPNASVS
jgi:aminoacyl tRNA synthase complex-interacting multifunctional protein 1